MTALGSVFGNCSSFTRIVCENVYPAPTLGWISQQINSTIMSAYFPAELVDTAKHTQYWYMLSGGIYSIDELDN